MTISSGRLFIITGHLPLPLAEESGRPPMLYCDDITSAMSSFLHRGNTGNSPVFSEIGWAGAASYKRINGDLLPVDQQADGYTCYPIFLPPKYEQVLEQGFGNTVLWPLFHYFPSYVEFSAVAYDDYFCMNGQFAESITRFLRPGDTVWIHDYQLLPLAGMLRQRVPELTIGLFLHISFPSFEIFRHLPGDWQEHLLKGMLGADLIGFQSREYAEHFRQTVRLALNTAGDGQIIEFENRLVTTGIFPLGIEYARFNNVRDTPSRQQITTHFARRFHSQKIIFSIDALDYTKGILHRIKACEEFLQQYPDYRNRIVFILVVVPSREHLTRYAERKRLIDESVSYLNGRYGTLDWQPLFYMYRTLDFDELVTLYRLCDVALLTPLRDAMNLYAKEFAASREDETGVLILSEFDGAAQQLDGALTVNPNDIPMVAQTIKAALGMPRQDQAARMQVLRQAVCDYDVSRWGEEFLLTLHRARGRQEEFQVRFFDSYSQRHLLDSYRNAGRRLFLLDYDGTLMPFFSRPSEAIPVEPVLETLARLADDHRNSVCIVSGRDSAILESWLGHLPVHIVAEHGAQVRYRDSSWQKIALPAEEWESNILPAMDRFTRSCPGAFIEKKNFSIVWHYRNAEAQLAEKAKMELYAALCDITNSLPLQVTTGKKIIEVRNKDIDKGSAVRTLLSHVAGEFVLAAGDDRTDEDMFRALAHHQHAFTIKVGQDASYARFNVHTPQSLISLLDTLGHLRT